MMSYYKNIIKALVFIIIKLVYRFNNARILDSITFWKKSLNKNKDYHLCVFVTAGNFIEHVMPIIIWLKEHYTCYISIVLYDIADCYIDNNPDGMKLLQNYVDRIISKHAYKTDSFIGRFIGNIKFGKMIDYAWDTDSVNAFLMTRDVLNCPWTAKIKKRFPKAVITTMESTCFNGSNIPAYGGGWPQAPIDYMVVPDFISYKGICSSKIKHKCVIGSPKLDYWWVKKQIKKEGYLFFDDVKHRKKGKKTMLFIFAAMDKRTRFVKKEKSDFSKIVFDLKDEYFFIFKFHPRDTREYRDKFIRTWVKPGVEYIICEYDIVVCSEFVDMSVILGITSGAAELWLRDKPVITFFNRKIPRPEITDRDCNQHGGVETYFEKNNLINHADTIDEFKCLIMCAQNGYADFITKKESKKEIVPCIGDNSSKIAQILMGGST